jgi:hypothetical protein
MWLILLEIECCAVWNSWSGATFSLEEVRRVLADLPPDQVQIVNTSPESDELRNAYLDARVVGPASSNDAAHIAVATVERVDLVVSWNFKHK